MSGELTTSRGPGTTFGFALALVEQLYGETVAKDVGELLVRFIANLPCDIFLDIFCCRCGTQTISLGFLSLVFFTFGLNIQNSWSIFPPVGLFSLHEAFLCEILKLAHSITKFLGLSLLRSYVS